MPMIDVYAASDLFPEGSDRTLAAELTAALLRAEGVKTPGPAHLNNTGAYIHRMPASTVHTAGTDAARTVRVQVVTPPAALTRDGQRQLVSRESAQVLGERRDLLARARSGGDTRRNFAPAVHSERW